MPVPFMSVALGIEEACSRRRRLTEGKSGRVWASEAGCEEGWIGLGEEEDSGCGSGGGGGDRSSLGGGGGLCSTSFGASRLDMSSPSSARRAMILPTATFFVPSGVCFNQFKINSQEPWGTHTTILPITPSSCASTSIVALSVSYNAFKYGKL